MKQILIYIIFLLFGAIAGKIISEELIPTTTALPTPYLPVAVPAEFSLDKAPSQSLKVKVATISGTVKWQSRIASQAASMTTTSIPIQQGEIISTEDDGTASLTIPSQFLITLEPLSRLTFIQLLPLDLVVSQEQGIITYKKIGNYPFSIRIKRLLVKNEGEIKAEIDEKRSLIVIEVLDGTITASYNDTNFVSQIVTVQKGQQFIFDNSRRKATVKEGLR